MRSLALWLIFGKVSTKKGRYAQNSKLADRKTVGMQWPFSGGMSCSVGNLHVCSRCKWRSYIQRSAARIKPPLQPSSAWMFSAFQVTAPARCFFFRVVRRSTLNSGRQFVPQI
jgi:hypothetical protein